MKKLLTVLMLILMVFTFAACTSEPVTEPKTTEQQANNTTDTTDTTVEIDDKLNIFTLNVDESTLMSKEDIKNIPLKINMGSCELIFTNWEECEKYCYLGNSTLIENPYKNKGAVLKIKVNKMIPCICYYPSIERTAPTTLLDVSVSEVFKTYNGYEVNKDETITLVQRSGYLKVDLKSFFEGYGAKVTLDNYQYTIEGLETGGDSKTGYYELFLQKDKEYVYQTELDTRLPILEEKEFLVMITYDEEEGRNFINYVCPVETSNYKSLSTYKDFNFSTQMDNFLTDFYNAFIGE